MKSASKAFLTAAAATAGVLAALVVIARITRPIQ